MSGMSEQEELKVVSESLFKFIVENKETVLKMNVFDLYNFWAKKTKTIIKHQANTVWAIDFIKQKEDVLSKLNHSMLEKLNL